MQAAWDFPWLLHVSMTAKVTWEMIASHNSIYDLLIDSINEVDRLINDLSNVNLVGSRLL